MTTTIGKGWLGGIEAEEEAGEASLVGGPSDTVYAVMKENLNELLLKEVGLDGAPLEPLDSYIHDGKPAPEKVSEPQPVSPAVPPTVPEHIKKAVGILSSFLRELAIMGAETGWDNRSGAPTKRFIEVKSAELRETLSLLRLASSEKCAISLILKNEGRHRTEKEQAIKNALLGSVFPNCP